MFICVYIYIYIYIHPSLSLSIYLSLSLSIYIYISYRGVNHLWTRGNHLSNTTCLPQVFFKSGELLRKLWCPLTRRRTHKTSEAVLDKKLAQ